jgi:hypothetical protein
MRMNYAGDHDYAEAHLAQAAVAYFLRNPDDMDAVQRNAFDTVHTLNFQRRMKDFDAKDLFALDAGAVSNMIKVFCKLFFFDSIPRIEFELATDSPRASSLADWTALRLTRIRIQQIHFADRAFTIWRYTDSYRRQARR